MLIFVMEFVLICTGSLWSTVNMGAAESAPVIQGPWEQPAFALATACFSTHRGQSLWCAVLESTAPGKPCSWSSRRPQGIKTLLKQRLVYAWKPVITRYSVKYGFIGKESLVFRPGKLPEDCCCSQLCLTHALPPQMHHLGQIFQKCPVIWSASLVLTQVWSTCRCPSISRT